MSIAAGDALPEVTVRIMRDGSQVALPLAEIAGQGKVVLFAVPGAFTPGCSKQHLPGFVQQAAEISGKGVDAILCLGVNDAWVMDAWGQAHGVGESILMVADPGADFTRAVGMEVDASQFGLGVRSKRYAMVIEDGVVTAVLPEEDGFSVNASSAACVLGAL